MAVKASSNKNSFFKTKNFLIVITIVLVIIIFTGYYICSVFQSLQYQLTHNTWKSGDTYLIFDDAKLIVVSKIAGVYKVNEFSYIRENDELRISEVYNSLAFIRYEDDILKLSSYEIYEDDYFPPFLNDDYTKTNYDILKYVKNDKNSSLNNNLSKYLGTWIYKSYDLDYATLNHYKQCTALYKLTYTIEKDGCKVTEYSERNSSDCSGYSYEEDKDEYCSYTIDKNTINIKYKLKKNVYSNDETLTYTGYTLVGSSKSKYNLSK